MLYERIHGNFFKLYMSGLNKLRNSRNIKASQTSAKWEPYKTPIERMMVKIMFLKNYSKNALDVLQYMTNFFPDNILLQVQL